MRECSIKPCPVNDGFGKWSEYSICTVSCGGGVQYRERKCNSPPPKYGGKDCNGPIRENRTCEEKECPGSLRVFSLCKNLYVMFIYSFKTSGEYWQSPDKK